MEPRWVGRGLIMLTFFFSLGPIAKSQEWKDTEIEAIFNGVKIDISAAIAEIETRGQTPYDFGRELLNRGKTEKAKQWFETLGIATNDPQYIYGLARVKWRTGNNHGALKDGYYLIHKDPAPLLRARTLYLLGTINIDERRFEKAYEDLQGAFDTYASIDGKYGGQYLSLSMMAWAAVAEGKYEKGRTYIERGLEYNEKLRTLGFEPYSLGFYYEILAEIDFRSGDYHGALIKTEESEVVYRQAGEILAADIMLAKSGLLKLMTGEPKEAGEIALDLWERSHKRPDRGRLIAYNEITLMKLDQCSNNEVERQKRESAARGWANSSAGGKALIELLEFVMNRNKVPCPLWR